MTSMLGRMIIPRRAALRSGSVALALAVLAAACAQPEMPEDRYYRLRAAPPAKATPLFNGTVEVDRFLADGLTAGRPIVYSEPGQPHRLQEYHYDFWTEPPTVMVRDEFVGYLRAARIADAVVTPETRVRPDHVLTGKIKRLEKISGPQPKGALEIEIGLRRVDGAKLMLLETYFAEYSADDNSVEAAVRALNQALDDILARLVADLGRR